MILTNRLSAEREAELRRRLEQHRRESPPKYNPFGASPPRPAVVESAEDYEKRVRLMQEARFTAAVNGGCCVC